MLATLRRNAQKKTLIVALLATGLLVPLLFELYRNKPSVAPLAIYNSLTIPSVDVGLVRPGQTTRLSCAISNKGKTTIRLMPPKVSCGCVSLNNGSTTLAPGASQMLNFTYRASDAPKIIDEKIILQSTDFASLSWTINLHGKIDADVWAKPSALSILIDERGVGDAFLYINHSSNSLPGEIITPSPDLEVTSLQESNGLTPVKVSIKPSGGVRSDSGSSIINVFSHAEPRKKILSVPVSWSSRAKFFCTPAALQLRDYKKSQSTFSESLVLRGLSKAEADSLTIEVLASWVSLDLREQVGNSLKLTLKFTPHLMPNKVDQDILTLCLPTGPCQKIHVFGLTEP